jgi:hypothetical protein
VVNEWLTAARQVNALLEPPGLDGLEGAEFSRRLIEAFYSRQWGVILGAREGQGEGCWGFGECG